MGEMYDAWTRARNAARGPALKSIYLIGSLRNPRVPEVAKQLRGAGFDVFDDWYAAGPEADDKWRDYEIARGRNFIEALDGEACRHVYEFDKKNLDRCDTAVLLMPAGKSCHLELGYKIGTGKPGYIILDQDPERFDAMYRFAKEHNGNVFQNVDGFLSAMVR